MKHGNILALFNADEAMIAEVAAIVAANATQYKLFGNLFYIATANIDKAKNIAGALKHLPVVFIFYYNNIPNGSALLTNEGNPDLEAIKNILL